MVLVIGGDHLGSIAPNLQALGFDQVVHVSGRNVRRVDIPTGAQLVLVLIDYVNHNLARGIKEQAKAKSVPICFSRRSWSSVCQSLNNCGMNCPAAAQCARARALVQPVRAAAAAG